MYVAGNLLLMIMSDADQASHTVFLKLRSREESHKPSCQLFIARMTFDALVS